MRALVKFKLSCTLPLAKAADKTVTEKEVSKSKDF